MEQGFFRYGIAKHGSGGAMWRRIVRVIVMFTVLLGVQKVTLGQTDTWCLSQSESAELARRNQETILTIGIDLDTLRADVTTLREQRTQMQTQRTIFDNCRGNNSLLWEIVCSGEANAHNATVRKYNELNASISSRQEIAKNQLRINRTMFRMCN